jgi:hypothetical protein
LSENEEKEVNKKKSNTNSDKKKEIRVWEEIIKAYSEN